MSTIAQIGDPILKQVAAPVTEFNQALTLLVEQMLQTIEYEKGVGIAAPQLSVSLAVFILASHPNERYPKAPQMEPLTIINPKIEAVSPELVPSNEGCLSIPRRKLKVMRHTWVEASFQDVSGQWHKQRFEGFVANIFQHEYDHLQGITLMERIKLSPLQVG